MAGSDTVDYTPGLIKEKLAAGETVFVDYAADWCGTCKRQERIVNELRANNPDFDKNISFVRVDWDSFSSHEVTTSRKVPRRSTLIVLRGEEELGRIVAGTSTEEIKALLELGLASS
jgi:thiol-disulfide isomerase/thioredoxin